MKNIFYYFYSSPKKGEDGNWFPRLGNVE